MPDPIAEGLFCDTVPSKLKGYTSKELTSKLSKLLELGPPSKETHHPELESAEFTFPLNVVRPNVDTVLL